MVVRYCGRIAVIMFGIFNFNSVAICLEIDPVYPNIVFIIDNTTEHTCVPALNRFVEEPGALNLRSSCLVLTARSRMGKGCLSRMVSRTIMSATSSLSAPFSTHDGFSLRSSLAHANKSGGNCIKIDLHEKLILRDYFQENMTSRRPLLLPRISFPGRPIDIQFIPGGNCIK